MKTLVATVLIALVSPFAGASIHISQLANHCAGQVTAIQTSDASYSPEIPSHGRYPGAPARASFAALVTFASLNMDCTELAAKYHLDFSQPLKVYVSVSASNLAETQAIAKQFVGHQLQAEWKQYFEYREQTILPFYPSIHDESLALVGSDSAYSMGSSFQVNSLQVYGVPGLQVLTDAQKLSLAQEVVNYQVAKAKEPGWDVPFVSLLVSLNPSTAQAQVSYLNILVSLLETLTPDKTTSFFYKFNVGGSSGEPVARMINDLAAKTGAFNSAQLGKIAFEFPHLLLIGYTDAIETGVCFPADHEALKIALTQWESAAHLNYQQVDGAKWVAGSLTGHGGVLQFCLNKFKADAELNVLADKVLNKLNQGAH